MTSPAWRECIHAWEPTCSFAPPATEQALVAAERSLRMALPGDLRSLLGQSNGVADAMGGSFVWPVEQIAADNLDFRSRAEFGELYMPFDHLLFFGDAGNGDQFALPIAAGAVRHPDVFVWNHETDSRNSIAPSLERYLEWWLTGKIDV